VPVGVDLAAIAGASPPGTLTFGAAACAAVNDDAGDAIAIAATLNAPAAPSVIACRTNLFFNDTPLLGSHSTHCVDRADAKAASGQLYQNDWRCVGKTTKTRNFIC
jgi:hypothetical protein